jgi:hypothetical protein
MPSPQTPLPERARGFENLQLFLAPLLLLWEKGLGDEGKRFVSQSDGYLIRTHQKSATFKRETMGIKLEEHCVSPFLP